MKFSIATALLAALLSGCGGGSGVVQSATGSVDQTPSANAQASIKMTITVPGGASTQSGKRSGQYISASTLGLKVVVTDVPPTGGTASFAAITSVYALSTGPNVIVIPTPASATGHSEDLTYVAYTAAPVSNAIPASAKALAWGLTSGFVVQPGLNTNSIVLSAVVDGFAAPLAQTGAFGMMTSTPPTLIGTQKSLGFGGNATPNGIPTMNDAGGNNISTSTGSPWSVIGTVPPVATSPAAGVPVTIVETAGTCGASGSAPHLKLSYNGGTPAATAALSSTSDSIAAVYDGQGGVGWSAIISAKAQSQTLAYTLSSLGVTAVQTPSNTADWSCSNQTLSFSQSNETSLMTIVEHVPAQPYFITEPNTLNCTQLVNLYIGNTTAAASLITPGVATNLGAATTFTVQLIPAPPAAQACNIEIQDNSSFVAIPGGPLYPGATTYVQAVLPATATSIIVP